MDEIVASESWRVPMMMCGPRGRCVGGSQIGPKFIPQPTSQYTDLRIWTVAPSPAKYLHLPSESSAKLWQATMPTIAVDKAALFKELGKEYAV